MKIFLTGATGYIGGSVALALRAAGHSVSGLTRSSTGAKALSNAGVLPILGTLDDSDVLTAAARDSDAVFNCASADHIGAIEALVSGLAGSGKQFIHTSGSSIVGTQAMGQLLEPVYDDETPFTPSPGRAARVALNESVLASIEKQVHPVIVAPSLIYGGGHFGGRESMQVPWLIETAVRNKNARHLGPGENRWSNVHIDDLVKLYVAVLDHAPPGASYWAEAGENSMRELCEAINRMLDFNDPPDAMSAAEAAEEWGEGPAINTMGSNSRVRATRARRELGWTPLAPTALDEIERGHYAKTWRHS